jgi:hypothetical protein
MIGAKAKAQALISNQSWHADRSRCLDSLTFGTIGTCRLAEWATVIPLLNTAAGHGYPEPREIFASGTLKNQGTQKISEVAAAVVRIPWSWSFVTTGAHLRRNAELSQRLFARRASVHVDLHANRHFDYFWSLPGHLRSPLGRDGRCRTENKDRTPPKIAQASALSIWRTTVSMGTNRFAMQYDWGWRFTSGLVQSTRVGKPGPTQPSRPKNPNRNDDDRCAAAAQDAG